MNCNDKLINYCCPTLSVETLRALYLGDNDFEFLPPEVGHLKNLQIVSIFNLTPSTYCDIIMMLFKTFI